MDWKLSGLTEEEFRTQYDTAGREAFRWDTSIAWKSLNRIVCRGYDVNELAERISFSDMVFVLFQGRLPTMNEEAMLTYDMIAFVEHAFSPSAVSARAVAVGRPLLPSAIAAGVMTFGFAHGPGWQYSEMMAEYLGRAEREGHSSAEMADILVAEHLRDSRKILGLHQPQHTDGDPRAYRLIAKAKELGVARNYLAFQEEIVAAFQRKTGKHLHPNMLGAGGSVLLDLGFSPLAGWAIGVLCRAFSCAAHAIEEMTEQSAWRASRSNPMVDLLDLSLQGPKHYYGPPNRPVPTKEDRQKAELEGRVLPDTLPFQSPRARKRKATLTGVPNPQHRPL